MTAQIIVTDPFTQTRRSHDAEPGERLSDVLMQISPTRWNGAHVEIYEGAICQAGEFPIERARDRVLKKGEVYQVIVVPAEPISIGAAIAAAIGVTSTIGVALITVGVYIAIMAITMAISFLATMLLAPNRQSNKALASVDQPSGLNSLAPPRNSFRLGSRIADIYGTMRFWPDLIFNATSIWSPVGWHANLNVWRENPRTTSQQTATAVYCIGRGTYQLSDFQFGDSPISPASGSVQVYPPGVPLPGSITATYPVANLSRQDLGGPGSINMWSPWYEIPSNWIDFFDVQISHPQGLIVLYAGKKVPPGLATQGQADITIQAERLDADDTVIQTMQWTHANVALTRNELRITHRQVVDPGRWRVRVAETRVHVPYPNGNTETLFNRTALEGIVGHRHLSEADRTFEHETVVVVTASNVGSAAMQNMENFNALATRVLPTMDTPGVLTEPRTDNRWITAAINTLTDPFICNYSLAEVDWPSLFAVQNSLDSYGDGLVETEFCGVLDRQMTADEQLMLIARKARCFVFPSAGRITFARDERRTGVSALFNRRNRLVGRNDVGMGLQFAGRDDPDGVTISWIDAARGYSHQTYTYPTDRTPSNPLTIDLIGAVRSWEVCRRARFEMAQIIYRRRSMPLRVTEEGQLLLPFDRVAIVMPWDEGVIDGEVLEVDGLDLRLNRPVPEGLGPEAVIRLRAQDGRQTQLIVVEANGLRGPDWVTLAEEPSFDILGEADDRQVGTLFMLSTTEANDTATHWLMTGAEIDDQGVAITTMEDADEVYQLSDDILDPCAEEEPPGPPEVGCSLDTYEDLWTGEYLGWHDNPALIGQLVMAPVVGSLISRFCINIDLTRLNASYGAGYSPYWSARNMAYGAMTPLYPEGFTYDYAELLDSLLDPNTGLSPEAIADSGSWVDNDSWWMGAQPATRAWNWGFGYLGTFDAFMTVGQAGLWAPLAFYEGTRDFKDGAVVPPTFGATAHMIVGLFWSPNPVSGFISPSALFRVVVRDAYVENFPILDEFTANWNQIANPKGAGYLIKLARMDAYSGKAEFVDGVFPGPDWDIRNRAKRVFKANGRFMIEIHWPT